MSDCPICKHPNVGARHYHPYPNPLYRKPDYKTHCLNCNKLLIFDTHHWECENSVLCCQCYAWIDSLAPDEIEKVEARLLEKERLNKNGANLHTF